MRVARAHLCSPPPTNAPRRSKILHGHVDVTAEVVTEGATELLLDAKHIAVDSVRDLTSNEKVPHALLG